MSEKLSSSTLEFIKQEVERVQFGQVIIEINDYTDTLDVLVQERLRFEKKDKIPKKLIKGRN